MSFGSFLSNAVKSVGHVAESVAAPVIHTAGSVVHTAEHAAGSVAHTVEHAASSVAHTAGGALQALGRPIGHGISSVADVVGKVGIGPVTIGNMAHFVDKTFQDASDKILKIPVLGPVFGIGTGVQFYKTLLNVAEGQRIDKAALTGLKNEIKNYKAVAPYAASVISFVPGVGQGIGGGIMAASALAEGQPLTQVALEAIKGSIPGGPVAQMAFNVAQAAARGEKIDQIAIDALPVSAQVKDAIKSGMALTKDLADGKRIDKALLARVDDAMKLVSPEIGKALQVGTAVGLAKGIQDQVEKQISSPQAKQILGEIGNKIAAAQPIINAARNMSTSPAFHDGFDMAVGILHGKTIDQNMITGLRDSLNSEQKKGFDAGAALHIGRKLGRAHVAKKLGSRVKTKSGPVASPTQKAGFFITHGLVGADVNQKTEIMSHVVSNPEAKIGATDAIKEIAESRQDEGIWQKILHFFGFHGEPSTEGFKG